MKRHTHVLTLALIVNLVLALASDWQPANRVLVIITSLLVIVAALYTLFNDYELKKSVNQ